MSDPYQQTQQTSTASKSGGGCMGGCLKMLMVSAVLGGIALILLAVAGGVVYMNWDKLGLPPMEEMKQDFDKGFTQGLERAKDRVEQQAKQNAQTAEKAKGNASAKPKRPIAGSSPMHVNKSSFAKMSQRSDVLVLVDYHADWCGPSKRLDPHLAKLAREHGDKVIVLKVNVDSDGELAQQAGVSSIPDVRILHGGKQLEKFVGLQSYKKIEALILKHESALPAPRAGAVLPQSNGVGSIDPVTKKYMPPGMSRK